MNEDWQIWRIAWWPSATKGNERIDSQGLWVRMIGSLFWLAMRR